MYVCMYVCMYACMYVCMYHHRHCSIPKHTLPPKSKEYILVKEYILWGICHMANVPPEGIPYGKPSPGRNPMAELPQGGNNTIW